MITPETDMADAVDLQRLRAERRERVLAGMVEEGLDAVVLGTGANIRYATGATPLWLAGTRPWAPLAVVRRDAAALGHYCRGPHTQYVA